MKKFLIVLCCLTLALASCKKDDPDPETPANPDPPVVPVTPCDPPYDLSHTINEFDVTLYWSGTSELYELYCNDSLIASEISDTSYVDVVSDYGTYIYKVKGVCGETDSDFSEECTVLLYSGNDQCPAPENLTAQTVDNNITISWTGYSDTYVIYRNNDSLTEIAETSFADMNLEPGNYKYWVFGRCNDLGGILSQPSNIVEAVVEEVVITCPAPENLIAQTDDNDITLSWTGYSDTYVIYRNNESLTEITETSYIDMNLEPGNYTYWVIGKCDDLGGILSQPSNTVEAIVEEVVIPCNPPTDFSAVVTEQNDVLLSWTGDADSYTIYRDNYQLVTGITELSYTDLAPGFGTFVYKVKSVCNNQESPFSDEVSVDIIEPQDNPMVGDYNGEAVLNGNITIMSQNIPYSDTLTPIQLIVNEGDNANTLNITMIYDGSQKQFVAHVNGNNITGDDQYIEDMIIPISFMGMTFNIETDMLLSNIVGVFNPDNESINGTGLVTGTGTIEIPFLGQQQVDINLPMTAIFIK